MSPVDIWGVGIYHIKYKLRYSLGNAREEKYLSMLLNQILPLFLVDYRKVNEKTQLSNAKQGTFKESTGEGGPVITDPALGNKAGGPLSSARWAEILCHHKAFQCAIEIHAAYTSHCIE